MVITSEKNRRLRIIRCRSPSGLPPEHDSHSTTLSVSRMTEINETNEEQRTPGFQRALVGKLIAVGIFVALGTVAVFYSMKACKNCEVTGEPDDQIAALEENEPSESSDDLAAPVTSLSDVSTSKSNLNIKPVSASSKSSLPPITNPSKLQTPNDRAKRPERFASKSANDKSSFGGNQLIPKRVTAQRPPSKTFKPATQEIGSSSNNSFRSNQFGGQAPLQPKPLQLPKKEKLGWCGRNGRQSVSKTKGLDNQSGEQGDRKYKGHH